MNLESDSPSQTDPSSSPDETPQRHNPDPPIAAIESEAEDFLLAMFGTPPSTPCSNDCGCSIREGDRVSLVIVYTAEGLTEAHDIHCRNCNLPEPSDLKIGEWAGYVTGTAAPNKWVGGGGDCLTVDDATITKIEAVPGA